MTYPNHDDLLLKIRSQVRAGNVDAVVAGLSDNPELIHYNNRVGNWLHFAARGDSPEMLEELVRLGVDINESRGNAIPEYPLTFALDQANGRVIRKLLELGADPCLGIPVIGAIASGNKESLEFVKLLEQFGADLHLVYPYGEQRQPMNALAMAMFLGKKDVIDYLRSRGARLPEEYSKGELAAYAAGREPPAPKRI